MSNLYWLSEAQMERLKPFFPKSHGNRARTAGPMRGPVRCYSKSCSTGISGRSAGGIGKSRRSRACAHFST